MKELIEKKLEEKLNDGSLDKIIGEGIDKLFKETINDLLGWNSPVKKQLEEKLKPIMSEAVEACNLSEYAIKATAMINDLLENSPLSQYKESLSNLKEFLGTTFQYKQKVTISEIFEKYCEFIEKEAFKESDFDSDEINRDDGVENVYVDCYVKVIKKDEKSYFSTSETYTVKLHNEKAQDNEKLTEKTAFEFNLRKCSYDNAINIEYGLDCSVRDLRHMNSFAVYLMQLKNSFVDIQLDTMEESEDVSIEFEWNVG